MIWRMLILGISLIAAKASHAADIFVDDPSNQVPFIYVVGRLELGDENKFINIALRHSQAIVVFNSDGGNLRAGLEIGRAIRLKRYATLVTPNQICASACALAWLAGTPRGLTIGALIGFHAASDQDRNVVASGNALIGAYLTNLGLSDSAIVYVTQAAPSDMAWLTPESAGRSGIEVRLINPNSADSSTRVPPAGSAPRPPSRPETPTVSLHQSAVGFLGRHFQAFNRDINSVSAYISSVYAERVFYFGNERQRHEIIANNHNFMVRWPVRTYVVRPNETIIECPPTGIFCFIIAVVDWSATSFERRITSTGASRIEMTIDMSGTAPRIVRENGTVLTRSVARHQSPTPPPSSVAPTLLQGSRP